MPASTASAIPALQGAIDRVRADLLLTSSGSARLQEALQTSGLPVVAIQRQQQATAAFTERSDRLLAALDAVTLTYDVSYLGTFSGGYAFTGDNVRLRLPPSLLQLRLTGRPCPP